MAFWAFLALHVKSTCLLSTGKFSSQTMDPDEPQNQKSSNIKWLQRVILFVIVVLIEILLLIVFLSSYFHQKRSLKKLIYLQNNTSLSANACEWREDLIHFVNSNDSMGLKHTIPPYLISFQGSGNTYTRLMIELITNFYTGSALPNDRFLIEAGFKGDTRCDDSALILKAHVKISSFHQVFTHVMMNIAKLVNGPSQTISDRKVTKVQIQKYQRCYWDWRHIPGQKSVECVLFRMATNAKCFAEWSCL